jgi:hypothetical protein
MPCTCINISSPFLNFIIYYFVHVTSYLFSQHKSNQKKIFWYKNYILKHNSGIKKICMATTIYIGQWENMAQIMFLQSKFSTAKFNFKAYHAIIMHQNYLHWVWIHRNHTAFKNCLISELQRQQSWPILTCLL